MRSTNFKTENNSLRKLLGNGLFYKIPRFQRDYSWTLEQWGRFVDRYFKYNRRSLLKRMILITWVIWYYSLLMKIGRASCRERV